MAQPDRRTVLRWGGATLAAAGAGLLAACSSDPNSVAEQAKAGDDKNYVAGDGSIEALAPESRGEPVSLTGTTLEGKPWSMDDVAGAVLVVNVWGSWCPPCIDETDDLQAAWVRLQKERKKVAFLGLDKLEGAATGLAYQEANGVTYPSLAYDGGVPILSLQGKAAATPTTLVLDPQGRIAARVSGPVTTSTLVGLVDDVLSQGA
jgi:thiol-disulfide isomerase/thioredoxin